MREEPDLRISVCRMDRGMKHRVKTFLKGIGWLLGALGLWLFYLVLVGENPTGWGTFGVIMMALWGVVQVASSFLPTKYEQRHCANCGAVTEQFQSKRDSKSRRTYVCENCGREIVVLLSKGAEVSLVEPTISPMIAELTVEDRTYMTLCPSCKAPIARAALQCAKCKESMIGKEETLATQPSIQELLDTGQMRVWQPAPDVSRPPPPSPEPTRPITGQPIGKPTAPTKFCRYCGAKIVRDSKFCEECGKRLV